MSIQIPAPMPSPCPAAGEPTSGAKVARPTARPKRVSTIWVASAKMAPAMMAPQEIRAKGRSYPRIASSEAAPREPILSSVRGVVGVIISINVNCPLINRHRLGAGLSAHGGTEARVLPYERLRLFTKGARLQGQKRGVCSLICAPEPWRDACRSAPRTAAQPPVCKPAGAARLRPSSHRRQG